MRRGSQAWIKFSLVVMGTTVPLLVLAMAELGLRVLRPGKVREISAERSRVERLAYVFHPQYLIGLKPDTRRDREEFAGSGIVTWQTNADGFRGPPLKASPETRIIVYGDSNIEARFASLEDTYPARLGHHLQASSDTDLEVINGGIVGSGPDQSLLRFAEQADRYKPDLIVFHVFADNDFGDIIRNRVFGLDENQELVSSGLRATPDPLLTSVGSRWLIVRAAQRLMGRVRVGSADDPLKGAYDSPEVYLERLAEVTALEWSQYQKGDTRVFSHFADHYDIDIALRPDEAPARTKVALMEGVLKRARNTAMEKGVKLLVLIQPSVIDMTDENFVLGAAYLSRFPAYRRERLSSIVEEICTRLQIHRLNLFPLFAATHPESLYFKRVDDHWNTAGQDLAARATADYIRAAWPALLARRSAH